MHVNIGFKRQIWKLLLAGTPLIANMAIFLRILAVQISGKQTIMTGIIHQPSVQWYLKGLEKEMEEKTRNTLSIVILKETSSKEVIEKWLNFGKNLWSLM